MILNVRHQTIYRYDQPVRAVVQSHRLTPSKFDGQATINWNISVEGGLTSEPFENAVPGGAFRDGAGDWVQSWTIAGPVSEVVVNVVGSVQTTDLHGVLRGHRERTPPEAYLSDTLMTRADLAVTELARKAESSAKTALERAHILSAAVSEAIEYIPGATQSQTTAAEALGMGKGVCQDHAHALIAAARAIGVPARYVFGYLHASELSAEHEASHAWAEIWVDGLGWVGFDASNACCPDDRYIRLGSGKDAHAAAPIRGIARGASEESMDVSVAVEAQQQ
jgi:transglutaminase-like putative cysteine protease